MQPVRGLGQAQPRRLGDVEEDVEERRRQRHVVVDDEHPVELGQRLAGQQRVEILELAAVPGGAGADHDVVTRAFELRDRGGQQAGHVGPLDGEHEDAAPGWAFGGGFEEVPPMARQLLRCVGGEIPGREEGAVLAGDRAAGAGEEVVFGGAGRVWGSRFLN